MEQQSFWIFRKIEQAVFRHVTIPFLHDLNVQHRSIED
jgi:hypothetical protein